MSKGFVNRLFFPDEMKHTTVQVSLEILKKGLMCHFFSRDQKA